MKKSQEPKADPRQPKMDDVLKRMLASPPDPKKRAKPVKNNEKKKPAA